MIPGSGVIQNAKARQAVSECPNPEPGRVLRRAGQIAIGLDGEADLGIQARGVCNLGLSKSRVKIVAFMEQADMSRKRYVLRLVLASLTILGTAVWIASWRIPTGAAAKSIG